MRVFWALALSALSLHACRAPQDSAEPTSFKDCAACPEMVVIPAGSFKMGNLQDTPGANPDLPPWLSVDDEFPIHTVTFDTLFALGRTPVTVAQFRDFVHDSGYKPDGDCASFTREGLVVRDGSSWDNPPFEQGPNHPAACLSWMDATAYVSWLSDKTGETYRLPSEAEWEYAARAGAVTPFPSGLEMSHDSANYGAGPAGGLKEGADQWIYTSPVGSFAQNAFGLADMQGNVLEWLADCYAPNYEGAPTDGSARTENNGGQCQYAMLRGGSWSSAAFVLRLSNRDANERTARLDQYGFRIARDMR